MRWLQYFNPDNANLVAALARVYTQGKEIVELAKTRPRVRMVDHHGETVLVHVARYGVNCRQGRHRSVMIACEMAVYLREHQATVKIWYDSLYIGAFDITGRPNDRGEEREPQASRKSHGERRRHDAALVG